MPPDDPPKLDYARPASPPGRTSGTSAWLALVLSILPIPLSIIAEEYVLERFGIPLHVRARVMPFVFALPALAAATVASIALVRKTFAFIPAALALLSASGQLFILVRHAIFAIRQ